MKKSQEIKNKKKTFCFFFIRRIPRTHLPDGMTNAKTSSCNFGSWMAWRELNSLVCGCESMCFCSLFSDTVDKSNLKKNKCGLMNFFTFIGKNVSGSIASLAPKMLFFLFMFAQWNSHTKWIRVDSTFLFIETFQAFRWLTEFSNVRERDAVCI